LAVLLLVAAHVFATPALVPIPGIVSTGVGLSQGAIDVNYLLISAPSGVPANVLHPVVICQTVGCDGGTIPAFPFWSEGGGPVWAADNALSQWVGVKAIQYGDVSANAGPGTGITVGDPTGWYDFQVTFVLPNQQALDTAHISGLFSADNEGEIWLNSTGITGCYSPYCFQDMHPFNVTTGFVIGVNHLDFRIYNVNQALGNPMGFRVQMQGTYEVPEPATAALWLAGLATLAFLRRRKAS
jgi:hypothetical protein